MLLLNGSKSLKFLDDSFLQATTLRLQIEHVDDTSIRVRIPIDDQRLRHGCSVSGSTLMWLADRSTYLLTLARIGPVTDFTIFSDGIADSIVQATLT